MGQLIITYVNLSLIAAHRAITRKGTLENILKRKRLCHRHADGSITYIHTHMHACIHIHIHTYIHACMHTCILIHTHTYIRTHTHTDIHSHTHTYTHTYIHTYIHTHMHTYRYMYRHTANFFSSCAVQDVQRLE